MQCLLIYDIPNDRVRQRVADACLDYGLTRLQYSAFVGDLARSHQRGLFDEIRLRIGNHSANVQLFPLDEPSWAKRRILIQEDDQHGTNQP